jgi:hypothetical protein
MNLKYKASALIATVAVIFPVALGAEGVKLNNQIQVRENESGRSETRGESYKEKMEATSTIEASSSGRDNKGKEKERYSSSTNAESHRSLVSNFVQSLHEVSDREGGIGEQVRVVARSQNDSATTTLKAMEKVESRGSFRKFFFGEDYKNLGVIRSELATTTVNITNLKALYSNAITAEDKAVIIAQIASLEDEQIRLEAYVKDHEDTFSIFGWFSKFFSK